MNELWYDYVKAKHGENTRLLNFDIGSYIVLVKTGDIYKSIVEDAKTRFDILSFELDRPLRKGKNKE